jgi:hypothetical protein
MTAIERTAYPRFKRHPAPRELDTLYTPTPAELTWAAATARDALHRLHLLLWLKSFQRLGYFPRLTEIPLSVVTHLRACLHLDATVQPGYTHERMLYRHQQAVRTRLQVQAFDEAARAAIGTIVRQAGVVKDNPADLINVAIEELVRLRYELPAFSTLDRLVGHERSQIHAALFVQVQARLTVAGRVRDGEGVQRKQLPAAALAVLSQSSPCPVPDRACPHHLPDDSGSIAMPSLDVRVGATTHAGGVGACGDRPHLRQCCVATNVAVRRRRKLKLVRRHLEVCVFVHLADDLKTGDLCVAGSAQYADYRTQLLS